jgi:hypothetical protein
LTGRPLRSSAHHLQLDADDFAVALWLHDEDGEPAYTIRRRGIRTTRIAATLAAQEAQRKVKALWQ